MHSMTEESLVPDRPDMQVAILPQPTPCAHKLTTGTTDDL